MILFQLDLSKDGRWRILTEKVVNQPTPIELDAPGENEYEVWARANSVPPSLLIVLVLGGKQPIKIIDPAADNAEVFSAYHYLQIVSYLREQEYLPVEGRMSLVG